MSTQNESIHQENTCGSSAAAIGIPETSRWTVESLRSRVLYKIMDAMLTAPLNPRRAIRAYLRIILSERSSNYKRVGSTINLADQVIPGFSRRISNSLFSATQLPLTTRQINLISYGSGSTVFLLDTPGKLRVLKVFRRSLGKTGISLHKIAGEFQAKHRTISRWFDHTDFQIVPDAIFLILHGPLLGKPAAATLQSFIIGEKRDLFQDFQYNELFHLFQSDPHLKQQFIFFAGKVLDVAAEEKLCIDFIGRQNVLLIRDHTGNRLSIIDNGIFNLEHIRSTNPAVYSQIKAYLERLRQLMLELNTGCIR